MCLYVPNSWEWDEWHARISGRKTVLPESKQRLLIFPTKEMSKRSINMHHSCNWTTPASFKKTNTKHYRLSCNVRRFEQLPSRLDKLAICTNLQEIKLSSHHFAFQLWPLNCYLTTNFKILQDFPHEFAFVLPTHCHTSLSNRRNLVSSLPWATGTPPASHGMATWKPSSEGPFQGMQLGVCGLGVLYLE